MLGHGPESWHPDPEFFYEVGAGPMFDIGPYYLTALIAMLGPVRRVTGSTRIASPERTVGSGPSRATDQGDHADPHRGSAGLREWAGSDGRDQL